MWLALIWSRQVFSLHAYLDSLSSGIVAALWPVSGGYSGPSNDANPAAAHQQQRHDATTLIPAKPIPSGFVSAPTLYLITRRVVRDFVFGVRAAAAVGS